MSFRSAWKPLRVQAARPPGLRRITTGSALNTSQYPVLEKCPEPTCSCAVTPSMPEGLPIDMASKMSMPFYDRHVVLAGEVDANAWPSKIEQEPGSLLGRFKKLLGPSGECYRPDFSVSVSASTLPAGQDPASQSLTHAFVFPDFVRVDVGLGQHGPGNEGQGLKELARSIISDNSLTAGTGKAIQAPVILICGHGQRDQRCGIMGPILQREFENQLNRMENGHDSGGRNNSSACIGQISHVGGHKFAGNVIIYMPPRDSSSSIGTSLAGMGVWYGRVEPRHVEGIVRETIGKGRVIKELLRGVHDFGKQSS